MAVVGIKVVAVEGAGLVFYAFFDDAVEVVIGAQGDALGGGIDFFYGLILAA